MWGSLAQIILALLALANASLWHSSSIDSWLNHYQSHYVAQAASKQVHTEPLKLVNYQPTTENKANATQLSGGASAAALYNIDTGQYIYKKNIDQPLPIASLTKITTSLVILQHHKLDEEVKVPTLPNFTSDVTTLGIKAGQTYTVRDLLSATLIGSEADAATALAIWDSGSVDAFVPKMNKLAKSWQLNNTKYGGVVGLDDPSNYSSVADLIVLTQLGLRNAEFSKLVDSAQATITSKEGTSYHVVTTNQLLGRTGVVGVKTGTTGAAGQCFIGLQVVKNPDGSSRRLMSVVLHSPDRFNETLSMLNYSVTQFNWL